MSIVDVDTVTVENESELVDQALSRSLDAQHLLDFQTVIGLRSSVIDLVDRQDSTQAHAIRFNDPVIVGLDELGPLKLQHDVRPDFLQDVLAVVK